MKYLYPILTRFQHNLGQNIQAMASIQTNGTVQHVTKDSLKHAPATASILNNANKPVCHVTRLFIPVAASEPIKIVNGFLHLPQDYNAGRAEHSSTTAAILLSGAGGGVVGPSSIYLSIADKLASLSRGIPILRLDYRYPARNKHCVSDVVAAMNFLQKDYAVDRFLLVGWSFGGAPVFSVGGKDDRVTGCATIASQTSETEGIVQIARKNVPVLLMHGTADRILSPSCSESLYARYRQYS